MYKARLWCEQYVIDKEVQWIHITQMYRLTYTWAFTDKRGIMFCSLSRKAGIISMDVVTMCRQRF